MKHLEPYLRHIAKMSSIINKRPTVAYDCRLFYVLSGKGKFISEGGEISLSADTLLYYPCGISYHFRPDPADPMAFITVNFDFTGNYGIRELLCPVYTEAYDPRLLQPSHKEIDEPCFLSAFLLSEASHLLVYLIKMLAIKNSDITYAEELCGSLLRSLLLEMLSCKDKSGPKNPIVNEAMAYIRNNFSEALTNERIAESVKYHPYYIGALFREHLGKTPHEYVDEIRLRHAEQLLLLSDGSIYEISSQCGYKTPEHFTRRFKLRYGMTPTAWRKRHRLI